MAKIILDRDMYDSLLEEHASDNVTMIFKFGASWCGPCKRIEPHYEEYAKQADTTECYHMDIDEDSIGELMEELDLKLVPHFFMVRNTQVISTKQTSQKDELLSWIDKHSV